MRPYQGKAVFELLKRFPVYFTVLTAPTSGLPPALLGASGEAQETTDISRYAVGVRVAAQGLLEGVLLFVYRSLEPVSEARLESLCCSLEALPLGPSFHWEISLSIAGAGVRAA